MFRTACLEHPGLVPLAQRSGELWAALSQASGRRLVEPTGGLLIGPRAGHVVEGTLAAARRFDLPVELLDAGRVRKEYPLHASLPDSHAAVLEKTAALVRPERTILAAVEAAVAAGARTLTGTAVEGIELVGDGVVVRTAARNLRAGQVVVTAGPWLSSLVRDLPVEAVRMPMTWFAPSGDPAPFALDRFPVFIRELDEGGAIWGHGLGADLGPTGEVKLGLEDGGSAFSVVDADVSFPRCTDTSPEVASATRTDVHVPAPHPPEFRQRAVELARQRTKPVAELAQELRISESCLRNWMAQADTDDAGGDAPKLTSQEKKELAQLRRDKRRLEMEVEILKRAAAYFARENVLPN